MSATEDIGVRVMGKILHIDTPEGRVSVVSMELLQSVVREICLKLDALEREAKNTRGTLGLLSEALLQQVQELEKARQAAAGTSPVPHEPHTGE